MKRKGATRGIAHAGAGRRTCGGRPWGMLPVAIMLAAGLSRAAGYHVDFDRGDDGRDGLVPARAFQHCPGDPAAAGLAAATALQPGDTVRFKGGVVYRGTVVVTASGAAGRPLVFDGNTAGDWGQGRAIIDGGDALGGWQQCASAADAGGNPLWSGIFFVDVPQPKRGQSLNLCDAETALPIAQEPNPEDPFWQERTSTYWVAPRPLVADGMPQIAPEPGTRQNGARPLRLLLLNNGSSGAVVDPLVGGGFTITLDSPREIAAVGIEPQPRYAAPKDAAILGDGAELARVTLAKNAKKIQRFDLPAPTAITRLTIRFLSAWPGETGGFTAIRRVAAFTRDGHDVLAPPESMRFSDPAHLNRPGTNDYDGMTFAFHAGNNHIVNLPIRGYDPASGTLTLPVFAGRQYAQTRYCLLNSVRLIDQPGEYSVENTARSGIARVYLLPPRLADRRPIDIAGSVRSAGFALERASHVTVQGFLLRRQNGSALCAAGPAADIVFRDCEATLIRGTAVSASRADGIRVEDCYVHHNPGHTKGILLDSCNRAEIRDCRLVKNTSTAIDCYTCTNTQVIGNTVLEHLGSHANGLTFYLGCRNILVARNRVADGNVALTFQAGQGFVIRNNLLDGGLRSMVVGLWPAPPLRDVRFEHNTIVRSNPDVTWAVGLFSNSRQIEGLVVQNNIIDGVCSDHDVFRAGTFRNNLYTRIGQDQANGLAGQHELVQTNLVRIFAAPDRGDFHLCAGSPAIGAGVDVGVTEDADGKRRRGDRIDVGAFAFD